MERHRERPASPTTSPAAIGSSSVRVAMRSPSRPNVVRIWSRRPGSGSGSAARLVAARASAWASSRARLASTACCDAVTTSDPTVTATAMKTPKATTFSTSAIVKVLYGGTKYQFTSNEAMTAATAPTIVPPTAAMASTKVEHEEQFGRDRDVVAEWNGCGDQDRAARPPS